MEHIETSMRVEDRPNHVMPIIISDVITRSEAEELKAFMLTKATDPKNYRYEIYNRPDAWDPNNIIGRLQDKFRDFIKANFFLVGMLEPRLFVALRTDTDATYAELYGNFEGNGETLYSAVLTLNDDYEGGDTVYVNGLDFSPKVGDMVVHRQEFFNCWEVLKVTSGIRVDLMLVQTELQKRADYNEFPIEQSVDDGIEY
jgi:hypothetical protein